MKISILNISQIDENTFEYFLKKVPNTKKVMRYRNNIDRIRTLFGEVMTRHQSSQYLETTTNNISFDYNAYGKPFLSNEKNLHFNLSHSGEYVVTCFSSSNIGIDIEVIRPVDLQMVISNFTTPEINYVQGLTSDGQIHRFFEIWTRKESLLKNIGKGLSIPLDSFSVVKNLKGNYVLLNDINFQGSHYYFQKYSYSLDYLITVCSEINYFPQHLEEITYSEMM